MTEPRIDEINFKLPTEMINKNASIFEDGVLVFERKCICCGKTFKDSSTKSKLCDECYKIKYPAQAEYVIPKRKKGLCRRKTCNRKAIPGETLCKEHKNRTENESCMVNVTKTEQNPLLSLLPTETETNNCDIGNYEEVLNYTPQNLIKLRASTSEKDRQLIIDILENQLKNYEIKVELVKKVLLS